MPGETPLSHVELAALLRSHVEQTGILDAGLRRGILSGDAAVPEPYGSLARQIAEDSFRVTDAQVQAVREAAGSQKGAFEVVLTAAIGAGLRRWDAAARAIDEARDAAS